MKCSVLASLQLVKKGFEAKSALVGLHIVVSSQGKAGSITVPQENPERPQLD